MSSIDYIDIARVQIDKAIELYYEEDYICAITLAGAAEEIAGKILKHSNGEDSFLDELIKKAIKIDSVHQSKDIIYEMNRTRNLLKHFKNDDLSFKPFDDAVMIIMRSISNYVSFKNSKTDLMDKFVSDPKVLLFLEAISE